MYSTLLSSLADLDSRDETNALAVMDRSGVYRCATDEEVLFAAQRICGSRLKAGPNISSPAQLKEFLGFRLGNLQHEVFAVIHLDSQNNMLDYTEMFRGTLTQTSVYPREVVVECLKKGSAGVFLVHNHPSGIEAPSAADRTLTDRLKSALALVDVRVLDHVIVAGTRMASFAELGMV
jgi:DNA repair protein RadC